MSNVAINNNEIPFGTIIGNRYLIQKVLGQGGLGRTYLALDTHRFNEACVLKEFAPLGSGQYDIEKSRNLFKREAKILHQIAHPQIPKFLACFEGKGRLFLVQEYVKGKTYSQLLQERKQQGRVFSETEVVRWLMNMLPILTYIHQRGIIHRDISPDNMMQPQGKELPVLIDFGVGKLTNLSYPEQENQSSSHGHSFVGKMSFVGKIGYAPREQISMGRCSPSSDLYALGVTAIVLLTGKIPTLLLDHYTLEWQWRKYAQISEDVAEIIDKMVEDRPLQRYQAAQEVINSLGQLQQIQETSLTPDLISLDDSHLGQKTSLFPQEGVNRLPKSGEENFLPPVEEDTIINPSFSSRANFQAQDSNSKFSSTSYQNEEETKWIQPSRKTPEYNYQQIQSNQPVEDTIPPDLSSSYQDKSIFPEQQGQSGEPLESSPLPQRYAKPINKPSIKPTNRFSRTFIKHCQQELAYIIGPMASLIVEEILVQYAPSFPEELVDAIAEQIPDTHKAIQFKRKLLS